MKDVFLRLCSVYIPSAARTYNDRVVVGSGGDVGVVAMVVRVDDCLSLNTLDTYYVNYNVGHFSCGLMHANTAINGCGRGCCADSGRGGEDKIIWPMMCLIF